MQTNTVSLAALGTLRTFVESVRPVRLYYAYWGRNAWWSTWITRYNNGCIHTSSESARLFCEPKRVQGTVFYVNYLPALAFLSGKKALLVSEINTVDPLARLDRTSLAKIVQTLGVSSMTLEQFLRIFRAESGLWPAAFRRENSVFCTFCENASTLEDLTDTNETSATLTSSSVGPRYHLQWSERPAGIRSVGVASIAAHLRAGHVEH